VVTDAASTATPRRYQTIRTVTMYSLSIYIYIDIQIDAYIYYMDLSVVATGAASTATSLRYQRTKTQTVKIYISIYDLPLSLYI